MTAVSNKQEHIKSVTAITEVFADGQKVTAAAVEYDNKIDASKLLPSTFTVDGRTITKAYVNDTAAKTSQSIDGRYVILELSINDKEAPTIVERMKDNKPEAFRKVIKLKVTQVGEIITKDGVTYPANSETIVNNNEINLVADDFLKLQFNDIKSGQTLKYHLFIPKEYDRNKSYPLVVFLHDRGVCSETDDLGLIQGLGGVIWATPAEQAKHECFILVPQYPNAIVDDNFETIPPFDVTVDLINSIVNQYSIDTNRLYGTGQSMGCMSLVEISIQYPDLFAAVLLCAGQWDPRKISTLAHNNMWVLVSEGDTRAFNGMNECMTSLESAGAKISRAKWDGRRRGPDAEVYVKQVVEEGNNIKYTVYENGTVVPIDEQMGDAMFSNHMHTWRLVYTIEGLRDWLFTQKK